MNYLFSIPLLMNTVGARSTKFDVLLFEEGA